MPRTTKKQKAAQALWAAILDDVRPALSRPNFDTWLAPVTPVSLAGSVLILGAREVSIEWLENRLSGALQRSCDRVSTTPVSVTFMKYEDEGLAQSSGEGRLHHHLHEGGGPRRRPIGVYAQLTLWGVFDVSGFIKQHGRKRVKAAVAYTRSRRDIRNGGAYVRRVLADDHIPPPLNWAELAKRGRRRKAV